MGDFNINLLNNNNYSCQLFQNIYESVGLQQLINNPTRVTQFSSSLIDLIFTLLHTKTIDCGVRADFPVSDHYLVYAILDLNIFDVAPKYHTFRNFYNFNYHQFLIDIKELPWYHIYTISNVNDKLDVFHIFFLNLLSNTV